MPILVAGGGAAVLNRSTGVSLRASFPFTSPPCPSKTYQTPKPTVEAAPANTFAIVDNGNTQVVHLGSGVYSIEKIAGSSGVYDAGAVSSSGIADDFVVRLEEAGGTGSYLAGASDTPLADNDYPSIDYSWLLFQASFGWRVFTGPNPQTGYFAPQTYAWIWRTGTDVFWGRGATLADAKAAPDYTVAGSTGTFYFDSAFPFVGDKVNVTFYRPQELAGSTDLAFTAAGVVTGSGALAGPSALTFSTTGVLKGAAALGGASSLTFSPTATIRGAGPLSGASALTFSLAGALAGTGALRGAVTAAFTTAGTVQASGALSGATVLAFSTASILSGAGALAGVSSVAFTCSGTLAADGTLAGAVAVAFTAQGDLDAEAPASGAISGSASFAFILSGSLVAFEWFVRETRPALIPVADAAEPATATIVRQPRPPLADLG